MFVFGFYIRRKNGTDRYQTNLFPIYCLIAVLLGRIRYWKPSSPFMNASNLHLHHFTFKAGLWAIMSENIENVSQKSNLSDHRLSTLKDMIYHIQVHYNDEVTLNDIAAAGNVSSSTCLAILKKYLHDTPVNYLIKYRLKNAMELLQKSDLSIM